jgi:HlyD family secretion protein
MSEPGIFRKSSLEKLSTPEQLDHLMQVTTPRAWLALYTLCGILALALIWSVAAKLPTTISGRGILMPPRGVDELYAPGAGLISEVVVKEGDWVTVGQVVAHVEQRELQQKMKGSRREGEMKLAATRDRIRFLESQVKAKKEALALGLIAQADYETAAQSLSDSRAALAGLEGQSDTEGFQLKEASEVVSTKEGRVVEVTASVGALVSRGDSILTLTDEKQPIVANVFVPDVGNLAEPGMKAEVSPLIIKKEEFGYMLGKVTYASEYPVREKMVSDLVHNQSLSASLMRGGAPYLITVELAPDPATPSGFDWSSSKGPPEKIRAGMMCDVRIVVREQRPITMVIPALKSFLGL